MIVIEVIFLLLFWSWVFSASLFLRNTVLPRLPLDRTPADVRLAADTVRFNATDGVQLEGWKIQAHPGNPWVILCHGVGSNRSDLVDVAAGLAEAGLNSLLFDFRGHGGSQGRSTSFGYAEQRDLEGALAFLGSQPDLPDTPYGVYGISMGGAVALMVAARDERIGAVAVDSIYTSLSGTLERHLKLMYPVLPKIPFAWWIHSTYRLRFGIWPQRVSPREAIFAMEHRPVLVIHGGQDSRMPLAEIQAMLASGGSRELWVVQGAGHLEGLAMDPERYMAKLAGFFRAHLMKK